MRQWGNEMPRQWLLTASLSHCEIYWRGAPSDVEIAALDDTAGDAGGMGAAAQLVERQPVEAVHRLVLQLAPQGAHDLMAQRAAGGVIDRVVAGFELAHRAHDVAEADPPPLARQAIAAARPAYADEDAVAHQFLQHRLEIAARDALPRGDFRRAHRHGAAVIGDVEHRLDREEKFLGQPDHRRPPLLLGAAGAPFFTSVAGRLRQDKRKRRRSIRNRPPAAPRSVQM